MADDGYDARVEPLRRARAMWIPLVGGLALLGILLGVVVLSQSVGTDDIPPAAPPFQAPPVNPISSADVKLVDGPRLVIVRQTRAGTEEQELTVPAAARIERLQRIEPAGIRVGDWLTVIGVPNDVKYFSAQALIVIPGGGVPSTGGVVRSPAGFAGYESSRDPRTRAIIGGPVTAVDGIVVRLQGPTGEIRVTAGPEAPARLYRIEPASAEDIAEGDRIAGAFDADTLDAVLLFPVSGG